jgi:hypothetical protein
MSSRPLYRECLHRMATRFHCIDQSGRLSRRHSQTIGFLVDTDRGDSIRTIGSAERIDLEIRSTSSPYLFSKR